MPLLAMLNRLIPGKAAPEAAAWGAPRALDRGQVGRPQIAMDDHGNAIAAWHHRDAEGEGIYICRFRAEAREWDLVPRRLDSGRTRAQAPEIAMNVRGEMAVVWHEREGGESRVCARHMLGAAETWVPFPLTLHSGGGEVISLHTAMDPAGRIHVVWCQGAAGAYQVWASHYEGDPGAWSERPTPLGTPSRDPVYPQLAVNRTGQGIVAWSEEGTDGADRLVACHFDPQACAWSDRPTLVAPGRAACLRLGLDPRGSAILLWVEYPHGGIQNLHASHFDARTLEWTPGPLLGSAHAIHWPLVGLDGEGRALALWRQDLAGGTNLAARRWAGGQWSETRVTLAEDLGPRPAHGLSVNAEGQALAIWSQSQGPQSWICVRRFDGRTWTAHPLMLGAPSHRGIETPGAVLAAGGHVAAIWRQGDAQDGLIVSAVGRS